MAGIAEGRLREERRSWRKDHPIGFVARPRSKADGSTDLLNWDVVIPGKKDTMYAFPRPRCLLILVSGRVSTSCRHDGVPARRTRDVLPTVTPSPRRTLMTTPRACRWEGCEFNLTMEFSSDYPATAPVVKFVSRPGEVEEPCTNQPVSRRVWRGGRRDDSARMRREILFYAQVFWHLNVWSSGRICLNLLNEPDGTWHGQWSPSITIKQILCAIQELLDNPFPAGARPEVQTLYERNRPAYERRLRQEADKYRKRPLPDDDDDVVVIE